MENKYLLSKKIKKDHYLLYIKTNKEFLIVSKLNLILINKFLTESEESINEYLKKDYSKIDINKILKDIKILSAQKLENKIKCKEVEIPKLKNIFRFQLGKKYYSILSDGSIDFNDITGQLYHLKNESSKDPKSFQAFKLKNKYYLYFNSNLIGCWEKKFIHFLKGKIIYLSILNFHNSKQKDWSSFLHGSIISGKKKSMLIVGQSGSGKSSLTSLLVNKGHRLICDDIAPLKINCNFGNFPNALSIKNSKNGILNKINHQNFYTFPTMTYKGMNTYIFPKKGNIDTHEIDCKLVLKVKYEKNSNLKINKVDKIQILMEFINESYIIRKSKSVKSFMRWFTNCSFIDIKYSDSDKLIDFLNQKLY